MFLKSIIFICYTHLYSEYHGISGMLKTFHSSLIPVVCREQLLYMDSKLPVIKSFLPLGMIPVNHQSPTLKRIKSPSTRPTWERITVVSMNGTQSSFHSPVRRFNFWSIALVISTFEWGAVHYMHNRFGAIHRTNASGSDHVLTSIIHPMACM